ncbi:hypothetical protein GCM10010915_16630 [Microbacterium faecale]|uniref:DUF4352 domain-containing protein n=1 Tax=Microbacterium faecale TaxID=1804630 RepID=A0A916Y9W6_9MICO|nr:hypothetical protein GCM10010915_16630 [Microbacterium faecale]
MPDSGSGDAGSHPSGHGAPQQAPYAQQGQQLDYGPGGGPGTRPPTSPGRGTPWYARWYLWVAVATVIVAGAAIAAVVIFGPSMFGATGGEERPPATQSPSPEEDPGDGTGEPPSDDTGEPGQELALGESVAIGEDWEVVVDDPNMDATSDLLDRGNPEPPEGTVYVTINLTATNTGDEAAQIYDNIAMAYVDESGEQFLTSTAVAPDDAYLLSETPVGQSDSGNYVFEVPEGSEGGYWLVRVRTPHFTGPTFTYANE